jgi:serine/threonine protein kinase
MLAMGVHVNPPVLALVSEFIANGTLFDILHKSRRKPDLEIRKDIALQMARVLLYYNEAGVVHRDLKSLNVLLTESYIVKICDFGLARFRSDLNTGTM